MHMAAP